VDEIGAGDFPQAAEDTSDVSGAEGEAVAQAFGRPYRAPNGNMIIPVARVVQVNPSRGGSGGRRVVNAIPRAIIEVDEKGAHIKEISNTVVLGLAGMTLAAWNVFWIAKTIRAFARKRS
jgi:hypothetical protein